MAPPVMAVTLFLSHHQSIAPSHQRCHNNPSPRRVFIQHFLCVCVCGLWLTCPSLCVAFGRSASPIYTGSFDVVRSPHPATQQQAQLPQHAGDDLDSMLLFSAYQRSQAEVSSLRLSLEQSNRRLAGARQQARQDRERLLNKLEQKVRDDIAPLNCGNPWSLSHTHTLSSLL